MFVPKWLPGLVCAVFALFAVLVAWTSLLTVDRNPLPFPDRGSRIFTAPSPEAKAAIVALLDRHGIKERFEANSSGIQRTIMWDGTIINYAPPEVLQKLGNASASIGIVADDPVASAQDAVALLRSRGFAAEVVLDAEPGIPIAFVVTDATSGTAFSFRKHMIDMPRDQLVSTDGQ